MRRAFGLITHRVPSIGDHPPRPYPSLITSSRQSCNAIRDERDCSFTMLTEHMRCAGPQLAIGSHPHVACMHRPLSPSEIQSSTDARQETLIGGSINSILLKFR